MSARVYTSVMDHIPTTLHAHNMQNLLVSDLLCGNLNPYNHPPPTIMRLRLRNTWTDSTDFFHLESDSDDAVVLYRPSA